MLAALLALATMTTMLVALTEVVAHEVRLRRRAFVHGEAVALEE